jgi:Flp pilus assembly pilin Flp
MMDLVKKLEASREEGQTMAEYAVILGVITLAVVAVFITLSTAIGTAVGAVAAAVETPRLGGGRPGPPGHPAASKGRASSSSRWCWCLCSCSSSASSSSASSCTTR